MDGERVADWRHLPRASGVFARARGEGFLLLCVGGIAQKGERVCCFVSFWLRFVLRYDFRYTALCFPFLCFGAIGFVSFFGAIRYSSQLMSFPCLMPFFFVSLPVSLGHTVRVSFRFRFIIRA